MVGRTRSLIQMAKRNRITVQCVSQMPHVPAGVWQPIKDAFVGEAAHKMFSFTNAQIINYFVVRTAVDGMPASDMKAINNSAVYLFCCGHVQDIRVNFEKYMCVQAKCLPEMRKIASIN